MRIRLLCLILCAWSVGLTGQEAWQTVPISNHGKSITSLKAIGVTGNCPIGGTQRKASFVIWGNKNGRELIFSLVVEPGVVPESILEKYHGPDLSDEIAKNRSLEISLKRKDGVDKIRLGVVVSATNLFPESIRLNNQEMFSSGITLNPKEQIKWAAFQHRLREPFISGTVVFSDRGLVNPITFSFENTGFEALYQELEGFLPFLK